MEEQENTGQEERIHQIWISECDRVASFHQVNGYERKIIRGQKAYIEMLQQLQNGGYRFQ